MENPISIMELRQNLRSIAKKAEQGQIFTVFKRSRPIFTIMPYDTKDGEWETILDYPAEGVTLGRSTNKLFRQMDQ